MVFGLKPQVLGDLGTVVWQVLPATATRQASCPSLTLSDTLSKLRPGWPL